MNGSSIKQLQPHGANIPRRQCIPILYTKGTHYDVGFDMVSFIILILMKLEPSRRFWRSFECLIRLTISDYRIPTNTQNWIRWNSFSWSFKSIIGIIIIPNVKTNNFWLSALPSFTYFVYIDKMVFYFPHFTSITRKR